MAAPLMPLIFDFFSFWKNSFVFLPISPQITFILLCAFFFSAYHGNVNPMQRENSCLRNTNFILIKKFLFSSILAMEGMEVEIANSKAT